MIEVIDLSVLVSPEREPEHTVFEPYADPPTIFDQYLSDYRERGYVITRLDMAAHAGTHIDVPIHVKSDGASITKLPINTFVGWAIVVDLRGRGPIGRDLLKPYRQRVTGNEDVIPVLLHNTKDPLTDEGRQEVCNWHSKAIVMGEGCNLNDKYEETFTFLRADIAMIMNADPMAAAKVQDGDLIVAAPLKLQGLEASPIRLLAIRGLPSPYRPSGQRRRWLHKVLPFLA